MPLGYPVNVTTINSSAGLLATRLRDWAFETSLLHTPIANLGTDDPTRIAALETLGFSATDAPEILRLVNVLNTVAQIYYGNATQATTYNFDNDLSSLWGVRG
jgi:hypothetical protein